MKRFKKILFIADGSKGETAALTRVLELARDNKASVCLLDVVEEYPDIRFLRAGLEQMWKFHKELVKSRKVTLQHLLKQMGSAAGGIRTSVRIREGKMVVEIIREVLKNSYDLVVKVSTGHPKITGMRLGTLDMSLLRKCPCPVLVLKPAKRIHHSRILAAVDLSHLLEDPDNLDRRIMDLACSQARLEESRLHVLHAWELPYQKILSGEARIKFYKTVPQMQKELRKVEKIHLDAITDFYGEYHPQVHMIKGQPEKVIPDFAARNKIDLVVMGTLARAGVEGLLIGNTAEKILSKIDCSVLAMKPEGFVSPVTL